MPYPEPTADPHVKRVFAVMLILGLVVMFWLGVELTRAALGWLPRQSPRASRKTGIR